MKKLIVFAAITITCHMAQAQTELAMTALPLVVKASATKLVYKDFSVLSYANDGIGYRTYYNKRGSLLHTILSYKEDKLKASVRDRIINAYDEYQISWVDEIRTPDNGTVYRVQLKGLRKLLIVDVTDQDMLQEAEYKL
jgi:DNA gyrase/topoisomerase IV subunit B